ncbi:MAG: hypothetical protein KDB07_02595, partial [Planctomycetes bacterium]|nr:hypothetical protein [Planctomycetota bacterium]
RNAQFEGNADLAPYLNRITEAQQEAASFYANSLALDDDQAAVRVALAELFCRLASAADDELRSSYLNRARTLSARARSQLRQELQAPASTRRNDQASTTPLDANTIFAYASYQLGAIRYYQSLNDGDIAGFAEAEALHAEAIDALSFIDDSAAQRHYQTRTGAKDFKTSDVYLWAKYWREQLIMNQRRSRDLDSFNRTVTRESFEIDEVLGNGWGVQEGETLDAGVKGNCEVSGSKLVVRQGNQVEDGHISRISRADANNRIARFGVTIPRLGLSLTDRGMHMTIVRGANRSGQSRKPAETLMLGLDENFRVFWEFRTLEGEGNESKGKTLLEAGERIYLEDPAFYGLNENSSLTLEVSRYLEEGASSLRYSLFVNGVEFPIDLSNSSPILNQAGKNAGRSFSAVNNFKRKSQVAVYMGVFLRGREGDTGQIEVSEASWIYDS